MTNGELVKLLENRAVAYRAGAQDSLKRNTHLTESDSTPSQEMIDSVLVDFINYCAACQGMDSNEKI